MIRKSVSILIITITTNVVVGHPFHNFQNNPSGKNDSSVQSLKYTEANETTANHSMTRIWNGSPTGQYPFMVAILDVS